MPSAAYIAGMSLVTFAIGLYNWESMFPVFVGIKNFFFFFLPILCVAYVDILILPCLFVSTLVAKFFAPWGALVFADRRIELVKSILSFFELFSASFP